MPPGSTTSAKLARIVPRLFRRNSANTRASQCFRASSAMDLRAYPGWVAARVARWVFLNAIRPLASWSRARWFSSFLDHHLTEGRTAPVPGQGTGVSACADRAERVRRLLDALGQAG